MFHFSFPTHSRVRWSESFYKERHLLAYISSLLLPRSMFQLKCEIIHPRSISMCCVKIYIALSRPVELKSFVRLFIRHSTQFPFSIKYFDWVEIPVLIFIGGQRLCEVFFAFTLTFVDDKITTYVNSSDDAAFKAIFWEGGW